MSEFVNSWVQLEEKLHAEIVMLLKSFFGDSFDFNGGFVLEKPAQISFGDIACNVAMAYNSTFKDLGWSDKPREIAERLREILKKSDFIEEYFDKIEIAGAGFLNFFLKTDKKVVFWQALMIKENLIWDNMELEKNIIVEFSSPNIAKPFTIGHLRSTIIGAAVANLLEKVGYDVLKDNHLGDWGTQFGKQIVALERWGNLAEIKESSKPIKKLVELYVRFHQEAELDPSLEDEAREVFAKLEKNDQKYLTIWQEIVDLSMIEFDKIYKTLGVQFTENKGKGYGESFAALRTDKVIVQLQSKKLLKKSRGALVVEFDLENKLPPLIIVKNDGASIYATRDLAMDFYRKQKYGDNLIIINEVGKEQSLYFRQLFQVEIMAGWFKQDQRIFLSHGLYRFKDRKMSTRKGEVVWLEEVIEEAKERVRAMNKNLSESDVTKIALAAIKWNDLSREAVSDIDYDLEAMLSLKGDSGAYMLYSVIRARSILQKGDFGAFNELALWEKEEVKLIEQLIMYESKVRQAAEKLASHYLASYLFELAREFNNFYNQGKIAGNEQKMALTKGVEKVLTDGLCILGIQIPDKM